MHSLNTTARTAGAVYFVFMIVAIVGEFLFPTFVVSGDAPPTAANITAAELTYRVGILLGVVTHVVFLVLVVLLYRLFRGVDEGTALLMVVLVAEYRATANRFMTPLYFGEVPIIFWLLFRGAGKGRG